MGSLSRVPDFSPAAGRVSVSTVMSSSCPKATASSEAWVALGRAPNNTFRRSNPYSSPEGLRASSRPSVYSEK